MRTGDAIRSTREYLKLSMAGTARRIAETERRLARTFQETSRRGLPENRRKRRGLANLARTHAEREDDRARQLENLYREETGSEP